MLSLTGQPQAIRSMARSKIDEAEYRSIASVLGLSAFEIERAVTSFFSAIVVQADALPFDNVKKIFTWEKFEEYCEPVNIPYIGRIGPAYSRYLKWRRNEAKGLPSGKRSDYRVGLSRGEIEDIAEIILSGGTPQIIKKKNSELFNRVWLVGKDGKKSARQVISKEDKENGF